MKYLKRLLLAVAVLTICALPCENASEIAVPAAAQAERRVVPSGKSIGVTLSTDGVMVVSVTELESRGSMKSPAKDAGIKSGDLIKNFNGSEISGVDELNEAVSETNGARAAVTVMRGDRAVETLITPVKADEDGEYRIGAWVKDAASGIGTMTFYDAEKGTFAALGHGICDPKGGGVIAIDSGTILSSEIVSVQKGERGVPGELKGVFSEERSVLGSIVQNNGCGIYGKIGGDFPVGGESMPVAAKSEVHTGKAYILASVEGKTVEKFDAEIVRVMTQASPNPKSMVVRIIDPKLIEKTGGIVQGMSGCPIIQDEKLIGAITHVFVNDPTRGYAIFAEWMLDYSDSAA